DDAYHINDIGDTVVESSGGGTDTVLSTASNYTLRSNVENLTLEGFGNINGDGNSLANIMTGNSGHNRLAAGSGNDSIDAGAGNDTLDGGSGNDVLTGGAGNDVMNGGSGNDIFVFAAGYGADVINGFDSNPNGGQDKLDISSFDVANFAISSVGGG